MSATITEQQEMSEFMRTLGGRKTLAVPDIPDEYLQQVSGVFGCENSTIAILLVKDSVPLLEATYEVTIGW